jgi:chemotaxis protein MotA
MKISTLIGGFLCVLILFIAIYTKGDLSSYLDPIALLVTLGGTITSLISTYSATSLILALKDFFFNSTEDRYSHDDLVETIVAISKDSRSVTIKEIMDYDEVQKLPFFNNALKLITDNLPAEEIPLLLEKESYSILGKHKNSAKIFSVASNIAPLFGMIGTVIGLISMLGNMANPEVIPKAMSLALVTTLYGLITSVVIFRPMAGKLATKAEYTYMSRKIIIEGVIGIMNKKNSELIKAGLEKIYV